MAVGHQPRQRLTGDRPRINPVRSDDPAEEGVTARGAGSVIAGTMALTLTSEANSGNGDGVDGEIWGEASVTYPGWKGTAQLDERITIPWEGLAQAVGLDGDQWQVVGFSIGGGEHGYALHVVATPRDAWNKIKPGDGADIEVTEFRVHDVDPLAILQQMTHMFELKMRISGLDDRQVRVLALSDLPSELFVEETFGPQTG